MEDKNVDASIAGGEIQVEVTEDDSPKTVSVEEMQRRIAKEKQAYEELQAEMGRKVEEAVKRAKAEQSMSEDERVEAEKNELMEKIKRLEAERNQREIKDKAVSRLGEAGLPVSDEVLALVLRSSEGETEESITHLSAIITAVKKDLVSNDDLPISGGVEKKETPKGVQGLYEQYRIK